MDITTSEGKKYVRADRLRFLMDNANISRADLSVVTGIPAMTLRTYDKGIAAPGMDNLITLADYFGVSLDYLTGRIPDREAATEEEIYPKWYSTLFRAGYENIIRVGKTRPCLFNGRIAAPWPYNLYEDVFGKSESDQRVITKDMESGIYAAIDTLDERLKTVVLRRRI